MTVGLFIPVPAPLALGFPSLAPEDDSPPHVTLLYVGEAPAAGTEDTFLQVIQGIVQRLPSGIQATLTGKVGVFDNPDSYVLYDAVEFSHYLGDLRLDLAQGLQEAGFVVEDSHLDGYNPHVTLSYGPPGSGGGYRGKAPQGSWQVTSVEVWGLPGGDVVIPLDKTLVSKVASRFMTAEAKFKEKKKIKTMDGEDATVYVYSERQVANRHKEKAERVENLRKHISDLRARVKKDLKCKDGHKAMTALAVALMDDTCERVGNHESADDGHYGVTGWTVGHVTIKGSKATIKYVGKSGVDHEKVIEDASIVSALKPLLKGKKDGDRVLETEDDGGVNPEDVNEYLKEFDITAKDIRGFRANDEMCRALRDERAKGKDLPKDAKEKEKILKAEFKAALETVAETVGHESATLKSQYLVPGLEDNYLKDGTVLKDLTGGKKATRTEAEKEDDATEALIRPSPKNKPPRKDLQKHRVDTGDDDPDADADKRDQSQSDKRVAMAQRVAFSYLLSRVATEWDTKEQMEAYLKKTPGADPSNHTVKPAEDEKAPKGDAPSKDRRSPKDDAAEIPSQKTEESESGKGDPKEGPPKAKPGAPKKAPAAEDDDGPEVTEVSDDDSEVETPDAKPKKDKAPTPPPVDVGSRPGVSPEQAESLDDMIESVGSDPEFRTRLQEVIAAHLEEMDKIVAKSLGKGDVRSVIKALDMPTGKGDERAPFDEKKSEKRISDLSRNREKLKKEIKDTSERVKRAKKNLKALTSKDPGGRADKVKDRRDKLEADVTRARAQAAGLPKLHADLDKLRNYTDPKLKTLNQDWTDADDALAEAQERGDDSEIRTLQKKVDAAEAAYKDAEAASEDTRDEKITRLQEKIDKITEDASKAERAYDQGTKALAKDQEGAEEDDAESAKDHGEALEAAEKELTAAEDAHAALPVLTDKLSRVEELIGEAVASHHAGVVVMAAVMNPVLNPKKDVPRPDTVRNDSLDLYRALTPDQRESRVEATKAALAEVESKLASPPEDGKVRLEADGEFRRLRAEKEAYEADLEAADLAETTAPSSSDKAKSSGDLATDLVRAIHKSNPSSSRLFSLAKGTQDKDFRQNVHRSMADMSDEDFVEALSTHVPDRTRAMLDQLKKGTFENPMKDGKEEVLTDDMVQFLRQQVLNSVLNDSGAPGEPADEPGADPNAGSSTPTSKKPSAPKAPKAPKGKRQMPLWFKAFMDKAQKAKDFIYKPKKVAASRVAARWEQICIKDQG